MAACETALLNSAKSVINDLADNGSNAARVVQNFQKNPESIFATANITFIISLSIAAFLAGLFALEEIAPYLKSLEIYFLSDHSSAFSLLIIIPLFAFVAILTGELIPKSIALKFPIQLALFFAIPFLWISIASKPMIVLLQTISNLILKPFKDQTSFSESRASEEEFKILLEEGRKTGTIDKTEQELITSIFEFTDTTAKEVMVPRTDIVAIEINTPREKLVSMVLEEGYSRIPIYSESIDNIIGIVYTKDLISLLEHRNIIVLHDIIRPAYFVPETKKISVLLRELQKQKIHMAIVIDEYGGTEGIITLEDILEEIVGEIHDEYDEELKEVESSSDGSSLVNARINIQDFNDKFNVSIPESSEYDTLSGFLNKITGKIPELNEEIKYNDITFVIIKKSQRRIRQVKITKTENE